MLRNQCNIPRATGAVNGNKINEYATPQTSIPSTFNSSIELPNTKVCDDKEPSVPAYITTIIAIPILINHLIIWLDKRICLFRPPTKGKIRINGTMHCTKTNRNAIGSGVTKKGSTAITVNPIEHITAPKKLNINPIKTPFLLMQTDTTLSSKVKRLNYRLSTSLYY